MVISIGAALIFVVMVLVIGVMGLIVGFLIGGVVTLNSLKQNGYYFQRVNERWALFYRHPLRDAKRDQKTDELVRHEGYSGDNGNHSATADRIAN